MNTLAKNVAPSPLGEPRVAREHPNPQMFQASSLLKALGHEGRLLILCYLNDGERTVTQLQGLLPASQAVVSSHLARLRHEGVVTFRKEGKTCVYSIKDNKTRQVLNLVTTIFCGGLSRQD